MSSRDDISKKRDVGILTLFCKGSTENDFGSFSKVVAARALTSEPAMLLPVKHTPHLRLVCMHALL